MALKISSWGKSEQEELIPACKANEVLTVDLEDKKNKKLKYCDLQLCWNCFDWNYKYYFLRPKYDNTIENYIYNLDKFHFSFRELENSAEAERIFTMKKNKTCFINYCGLHYVSDEIGFALLYLNVEELKIYYYDFEQQFSSTIKIQIPDFNTKHAKLCCRSIWILTEIEDEDESYKGSFIDVININDKREWYHIRSNVCFSPIALTSVFSSVMVVADDFEDEFDGDYAGPVIFSSCKALYVNYDNLIPYQTHERSFIDFHKPIDLEMENLKVCGIFKSTIILAETCDWDGDYIYEDFCYFLSYDERLQLRVCKRIDLSIHSNPEIAICWVNSLEIIQEICKMFVKTSENWIFVIDLGTGQVSQILEYPSCFNVSRKKCLKWSKHDRMLNIIAHRYNEHTHHNESFNMKYGIFNGMTLKMLALNITVESFSLEKIQSYNLPHSLVREILNRKTY